jgi:hypothetical protein
VRRERPRLFDLTTREQIPVAEDLFANPWGLSHFRWEPDSSRFTFLYNQRGHQVLRIVVGPHANDRPRSRHSPMHHLTMALPRSNPQPNVSWTPIANA